MPYLHTSLALLAEGNLLDTTGTFALSVGASIVAYYICKWLDGRGKN